MDSYAILGLSQDATQEEIKTAFRREAMKWHPDRAGHSSASKEKFQQITHAYKILTRNNKNSSEADQFHSNPEWTRSEQQGSEDVFGDVMMEYAVGLVQSGLSSTEVEAKLIQNGLNINMAASIADRAFSFQESFVSRFDVLRKQGHNVFNVKGNTFDYSLTRAFLGVKNLNRSSAGSINHYQLIFHELVKKEDSGAVIPISKNSYLVKVLNLSILILIIVSAAIYLLPALTRYLPVGDIDLLQLPNILLSFMLVWAIYRKVWLLSLIGLSMIIVTQLFFYYSMPGALERNITSVIFISLICFTPFILLALYSNYFYFLKAIQVIGSISQLYPHQEERLVLVKNSGGTSLLAALVSAVILSLYFLHVIPESGSLSNKVNWLFFNRDSKVESIDIKQAKFRMSNSERFFIIAERHFNHQSPDYQRAETAYIESAIYGSLLAAYKLGYMHLLGKGVTQDDKKAFYYFHKAVQAPLASQPHNLSLTTKWLAESYNSLGVMYLGGYGTLKNHQKASEMFKQAMKYGSSTARKNLVLHNLLNIRDLRDLVTQPEYN